MKRWFVTLAASVVTVVFGTTSSVYGVWATGGTITTNGAYRIHTFTNSGTFKVGITGDVEVLVVGGGGGAGSGIGGNQYEGGGGGGGVIHTSSFPVAAGAIAVTVGAGGDPGVAWDGTQGGNSIFSTLTAIGGGYGAGNSGGTYGRPGGAGGSGGGAGNGPEGGTGGTGTPGQGYNGGSTFGMGGAAGGGGAGGAGSVMDGGPGITNSISGTPTGYGGGGGGANAGTATDGGGAGGEASAVAGTPNTGGGGGSAHAAYFGSAGGGSGIVIVRYIVSAPPSFYVWKDNLSPQWPFTNWVMAATSIQDAVNLAVDGDTVYVTNGTYNTGGTKAPGYGLTNRVYVTSAIILRSVNNDPAKTIIEGAADPVGDADGYGSNAVRGVYLTNGASLIGFTVTKGHTVLAATTPDYFDQYAGGVFLCANCVVSNCIIATNASYGGGGGAMLFGGGTIDSCLIVGNTNKGGGAGGGVYIKDAGMLNNCTVKGNYSGNYSAGVYVLYGGILNNCQILNNNAVVGGGGVQLIYGGSMKNCLVAGNFVSVYNIAGNYGGGIDIAGDSSPTVTVDNCTVVNNSIPKGGGGIAVRRGGGNTTVNNCIVWGNTTVYDSDSNIFVSATGVLNNCCSGPVWTNNGIGNIGVDPQLAGAGTGNYRLSATSPCLNTGTNLGWMTTTYPIDLDKHSRILYGVVDMGSYEFIRVGTVFGFK